MGWETRTTPHGRTHGPYYVRKERGEGGRVRSVYVGTGRVAEHVAELDRLSAEREALQRAADRFQLAPLDDVLARLRADAARLRVCRDAYLVATGHRAHRGEWRRRRGRHADGSPFAAPFFLTAPDDGADTMARKKSPAAPSHAERLGVSTGVGMGFVAGPEIMPQDDLDALGAVLDKVNVPKPTEHDVTALRGALVRLPERALGELAGPSGRRTVALAMNGGELGYAVAHVEAEAVRFGRSLAGDADGPLVRAAAVQAATARLVLDAVTRRYGTAFQGQYRIAEMEHLERRMSSAQTRYLRALATVAALRRAEGDERERAARLDAVPSPADRALSLVELLRGPDGPAAAQSPRERVRERIERIAAEHSPAERSGDSLPAPADVELVAGAVG